MKCFPLFVLLLLVGCATKPPPLPLTGDIFHDAPLAIEQGPPRDKVLWQYRLALAELRRGQFAAAKPLLDDALLTLGGIYSGDPSAAKSRRLFQQESRKTFIGEPYERVMAYFYRGVIYWHDGEPDNARACFRTAQLEDSDVENNQYTSDYTLLDYLEGLATVQLGGDGSDALKRAEKTARGPKPPAYDAKINVLVFLDFGPGPLKYGAGKYGEQLRFRTAASPVQTAQLQLDGRIAKLQPTDDLNFQATTRGGRVMDHVLANKAVFKGATDTFGNAALISGAVLASSGNSKSSANEVGAGLMIAGLVSKVVSAATTPQADVRCWDNLPQLLALGQFRLAPGQHTLTVDFLDAAGASQPKFTKQITFTVPAGRDAVIYVSDQSTTPQTQ